MNEGFKWEDYLKPSPDERGTLLRVFPRPKLNNFCQDWSTLSRWEKLAYDRLPDCSLLQRQQTQAVKIYILCTAVCKYYSLWKGPWKYCRWRGESLVLNGMEGSRNVHTLARTQMSRISDWWPILQSKNNTAWLSNIHFYGHLPVLQITPESIL